jgi:small subunit ribosomal protein S16
MVRIRLTRMGRRNRPFYRVVVMDSRRRRDGAYIDSLGFYDPIKDPAIMNINVEKAVEWILKGAQPTDTVRSIFSKFGVMKMVHEAKLEAKKNAEGEKEQS